MDAGHWTGACIVCNKNLAWSYLKHPYIRRELSKNLSAQVIGIFSLLLCTLEGQAADILLCRGLSWAGAQLWHGDGWWRAGCVLSHQTQSCSSWCPSHLWLQRGGSWLLQAAGALQVWGRVSGRDPCLISVPLILPMGCVNPLQLWLLESSLFTCLKWHLPPVAGLVLPAPHTDIQPLCSSGGLWCIPWGSQRFMCCWALAFPMSSRLPSQRLWHSGMCPHERGWRHCGLQEHRDTSTIWDRSDRSLINCDQWEDIWTASPPLLPLPPSDCRDPAYILVQKKTKQVKKTIIYANKGREPSLGGRDSLSSLLTATILRMNQTVDNETLWRDGSWWSP